MDQEFASRDQPRTGEKRIGNYILDKTLGKGTFGKVKLAVHILTGEKVAIKILEKSKIIDVADVERVSREIHILKLIRHPNIIQLYEIIESPKYLFLVMEYMESGELFDHIVSQKRIKEDEACKMFEQIISGIEYIHRLRIVHRDLKLQNLLIGYDKTLRIVDFGLSNTYKPEERLKTACGSPCYAAPEMIESKQPYQPLMVDIWSAGVILFAMVCGFLPFEDENTPNLYKKILNGEFSMRNQLSQELKDFIQRLLTVDPEKRIRPHEMKEHPWWKKHSDYYYPEGLIVGYHKIPIQPKILRQIRALQIDTDLTQKCIEANRHNNETTTYFLLLKRYLKQGNISKADFSGQYFDKKAIMPNQRKNKSHTLKPEDIIKRSSVSPKSMKKNRSKSLHKKNRKQNESFMESSTKMPRREKSKSKSKSKNHNKSKSKMNLKDKSVLRNQTFHLQERDENRRDRRHSYGKTPTLSQSLSKKRQELKEILTSDNQTRPQGRISSTTKNNSRRNATRSYMIGADCGVDWPLQPKWKNEHQAKPKIPSKRR